MMARNVIPLDPSRSPADAKLSATVLICTFNRARRLAETLDSLARSESRTLRWDVVVIDNNATDDTRQVAAARAATYPVPLRYLFEARQGKSYALNTGLRATDAEVIAFTDDDVRVSPGWLEAACRPILDNPSIAYTGGPVRPIWEQPRPSWIDLDRADLWGTLAILDYGSESFIFEDRKLVPLGANVAIRRARLDQIGGFDAALGRRGDLLLGQEQAELFCRSRAVGARGLYVPAMVVEHHVPASRLTYDYFRRWWYGKGVSRCRLEQMHPVTEFGVDLTRVRRLAGVPQFMWRTAGRDLAAWACALGCRDSRRRVKHAMMLYYFLGYLSACRSRSQDCASAESTRTLKTTDRLTGGFGLPGPAPVLAERLTGQPPESA
jgi:GT2 family glycosyltransferase